MNTLFALLAKFGDTNIPLDQCCMDYFGLAPKKAAEKACLQALPVPAYKLGSQRSPWFIDAKQLAEHIDQRRKQAQHDWDRLN